MTILKIPDPNDQEIPWWFFCGEEDWMVYDEDKDDDGGERYKRKLQDIAAAFEELGIQYSIKRQKIVFATPDDEHMALMHYGEYDG